MDSQLTRKDIEETRFKCVVCGYELTYPEFIHDNKCAFHTEIKPQIGLISWLLFALAEYRVWRKKLNMAKRGVPIETYMACLGNSQTEGDISAIKDYKGMDKLLNKLKDYKCQTQI